MATILQGFSSKGIEVSSLVAAGKGLSSRQQSSLPVPKRGSCLQKQNRPLSRISCFSPNSGRYGTMTMSSLYGLLGLDQNVELSEIKTAYRQLARKYHPDVCLPEDKEECTKLFLQVQDAYETLSDPLRRADYDLALRRGLSGSNRPRDLGKRGQRRGEDEVAPEEWKDRWESQLQNLGRRHTDNMSWGARMRARQQQQSS